MGDFVTEDHGELCLTVHVRQQSPRDIHVATRKSEGIQDGAVEYPKRELDPVLWRCFWPTKMTFFQNALPHLANVLRQFLIVIDTVLGHDGRVGLPTDFELTLPRITIRGFLTGYRARLVAAPDSDQADCEDIQFRAMTV
jgi:hypothetical protein